MKTGFGLGRIRDRLPQEQGPFETRQLGPVETQLRVVHHGHRLGQQGQPLFGMSAFPIRLCQQAQEIRLPQLGPRGQGGGETLTHLGNAILALSLHGQCPAV